MCTVTEYMLKNAQLELDQGLEILRATTGGHTLKSTEVRGLVKFFIRVIKMHQNIHMSNRNTLSTINIYNLGETFDSPYMSFDSRRNQPAYRVRFLENNKI